VSLTPVANGKNLQSEHFLCDSCSFLSCQQLIIAAGIVDTGGKFATGINNASETGGNIFHRYILGHLELRISPRIFENIQNGLNGILWGWGETD
jgi:hypothetical protein